MNVPFDMASILNTLRLVAWLAGDVFSQSHYIDLAVGRDGFVDFVDAGCDLEADVVAFFAEVAGVFRGGFYLIWVENDVIICDFKIFLAYYASLANVFNN